MFGKCRAIFLALLALGAVGSAAAQDAGYMVQPGDTLLISVWKEPDLQGDVLVTPDGAFAFPLVTLPTLVLLVALASPDWAFTFTLLVMAPVVFWVMLAVSVLLTDA